MSLQDEIITLEMDLLKPEVRRSPSALDRLISDDFLEIGGSGRSFGKDEVLSRLPQETPPTFSAQDFELRQLSDNLVQLLYKATMLKAGAAQTSYSLRSTLWQLKEDNWQMLFHQGTLCPPFDDE
ncbi:DUF4440 domain-containing protein [Thalassomonas sp. RHCl1]|uniref:nuclear transport factor 2 family protein n=1 Tax=Thalassomonas sp. RHCl1 TaxID=2995320 RepID=UPI00248BBAD2|nr:DUF4440 domain-containing protein [Thalassomonas sp. RHCl1]